RHAGLALLDLEAAQVLRGGRVGPAPEEGGEAADVADVVALGLVREPAQAHVIDQALAQGADRAGGEKIVHRGAPRMKEPRCSARLRRASNDTRRSRPYRALTTRTLPRSGFVLRPDDVMPDRHRAQNRTFGLAPIRVH